MIRPSLLNAGKISCPERDFNPRHPDLMEGPLTTELLRQPQWNKSNIDYQAFAPRRLGLLTRVYLSDDEQLCCVTFKYIVPSSIERHTVCLLIENCYFLVHGQGSNSPCF